MKKWPSLRELRFSYTHQIAACFNRDDLVETFTFVPHNKTTTQYMKPRVIILILAFIIIGLAAFAENPSAFSVTSAETGVFTVMYKRPETGKVKLSIYNDHNKLVFAEVLSNVGSFIRPYNFNELA
jgi:hypothetical protein